MASKWAQAQAELQFGGVAGSNLVNRIAESLDVAYFSGAENTLQRIERDTWKLRKEIMELEGKA